MPETYSSVWPNTLIRSRKKIITVGGCAVALAILTSSETHSTAAPKTPQALLTSSGAPLYVPSFDQRFEQSKEPREITERLQKNSRSKERTKPSAQCWDGDVQNLNHVTNAHAKKALANIAIACEIIADKQWYKQQPSAEINCLVELWDRESGWNENAQNSSSSAGGIPQALPMSKMKSAGADWRTNPATQIAWGVEYISYRYDSACGALKAHDQKGWY